MNGGSKPGSMAGTAHLSAHPTYRWSVRFARAWFDLYTWRVEASYAEPRRAELDFELWEHADAADRLERRITRTGLDIVARTLRGVPADVAWRSGALRGAARHLLPGPTPLLSDRSRPRLWLPIQPDHVFDQTNGTIQPDAIQPVPIQYGRPWCGPIGGIFGDHAA